MRLLLPAAGSSELWLSWGLGGMRLLWLALICCPAALALYLSLLERVRHCLLPALHGTFLGLTPLSPPGARGRCVECISAQPSQMWGPRGCSHVPLKAE